MSAPPNSIRKLRRLLALANDSDSPESRTAMRLYEKLIAKWEISPDAVDGGTPTWHTIRHTRGDKLILARIIGHFGWHGRTRRGKRLRIEVLCTKPEFQMLRDLYAHARGVAQAERNRLARMHASFVSGYLDRAFPLQWTNLPCPRCGQPYYNYSDQRGRFICGKCGHRSRKLKQIGGDRAAYLAGLRRGTTALTGNRLPKNHHPHVACVDH